MIMKLAKNTFAVVQVMSSKDMGWVITEDEYAMM
jgi:hypothetical protein